MIKLNWKVIGGYVYADTTTKTLQKNRGMIMLKVLTIVLIAILINVCISD